MFDATHMHHGSDGLSTVSCMSAIALPDLWRVSCDDRATAVRHARVAFVLFLFLPEDFSDMHAETFSQATWLPSTSLRSSRRAPEEVLLAVLGAHSSLPRTEITRKRNPEELYVAYCQNALRDKHGHLVRAQRVNDNTLVHLAWAIREQQQSREGYLHGDFMIRFWQADLIR